VFEPGCGIVDIPCGLRKMLLDVAGRMMTGHRETSHPDSDHTPLLLCGLETILRHLQAILSTLSLETLIIR
jgi:hypothetical protein